jgi:hypothetical protein
MFNITVHEIIFGRVIEKGIVKGKSRNLMLASDGMHIKGGKPKIADKVLKRNIHFIDGDKYMSCIKVRHSPLYLSNTDLAGRNIMAEFAQKKYGSWNCYPISGSNYRGIMVDSQ